MGQATWYLQSRITQCSDYSIILDQSRYAALVVQRYSTIADSEIDQRMKDQYATPIPTSAVFTTQQCSATYSDVMKIQKEYGFEYAELVGSLIYLMNTYVRLIYAIRKLARFMQYPGKYHFKRLRHLLRHIQCHRNKIKFYSNVAQSPLHVKVRKRNSYKLSHHMLHRFFISRLSRHCQINRWISHLHAWSSDRCYINNAYSHIAIYLRSGVLHLCIGCYG
jgi:hypothetical protein